MVNKVTWIKVPAPPGLKAALEQESRRRMMSQADTIRSILAKALKYTPEVNNEPQADRN
ncbi:MAG: hypothetical protein PHQ43_00260 [Dehalococcoidales bacterium]|nr:hypothetical protein [Dehalococcoidales bacterium]